MLLGALYIGVDNDPHSKTVVKSRIERTKFGLPRTTLTLNWKKEMGFQHLAKEETVQASITEEQERIYLIF